MLLTTLAGKAASLCLCLCLCSSRLQTWIFCIISDNSHLHDNTQPLECGCVLSPQVTEAVRIAQEKRPDLKLEGPLQYDAAVDPAVAKTKVKGHSEVAGRATVCIFPSLDTGNNTYKASPLLYCHMPILPLLASCNSNVRRRPCLLCLRGRLRPVSSRIKHGL